MRKRKQRGFAICQIVSLVVFFRLDKRWLGRESENDNVKLKQGANTFFLYLCKGQLAKTFADSQN